MCREFHRVMGTEGPSHTTLFRYATGTAKRRHVLTEHYVREAIHKITVELIEKELSESEKRREHVEKDLHQTEDRFRQLVENAKDIIYRYRLAPQRGFEYISPSVTDVLGYTPEVTIGCYEIERLPTGLRSRVPAKEVRPTTSLCPQLVALTMPRRAVDT